MEHNSADGCRERFFPVAKDPENPEACPCHGAEQAAFRVPQRRNEPQHIAEDAGDSVQLTETHAESAETEHQAHEQNAVGPELPVNAASHGEHRKGHGQSAHQTEQAVFYHEMKGQEHGEEAEGSQHRVQPDKIDQVAAEEQERKPVQDPVMAVDTGGIFRVGLLVHDVVDGIVVSVHVVALRLVPQKDLGRIKGIKHQDCQCRV